MATGGNSTSDPFDQNKGLPVGLPLHLVALQARRQISVLPQHDHNTESYGDRKKKKTAEFQNQRKQPNKDKNNPTSQGWRSHSAEPSKGNRDGKKKANAELISVQNWRKGANKDKNNPTLRDRNHSSLERTGPRPNQVRDGSSSSSQSDQKRQYYGASRDNAFSNDNSRRVYNDDQRNRDEHRRPPRDNGFGKGNDRRVYNDGGKNRDELGRPPRENRYDKRNNKDVFSSCDKGEYHGIRNMDSADDTVYPIGYKKLEELSLNEPLELVPLLAKRKECFFKLLKADMRPDMLVLVVKVLSKVCQVDFIQNKTAILANACDEKFLQKITQHIASMPADKNPARKDGIPSFFQDLLIFCEGIFTIFPTTACEYFSPILMLAKGTIDTFSSFHRIKFPDSMPGKLMELEAELIKLMDERETKSVKETSRHERLKYQAPPDNFRELSIFPRPEDVVHGKKAFVRPNIVEGAYESVEHYLDIQFRLLREDFVWPLRDGITNYIKQLENPEKKPKHRSDNVKIYQNVQFVRSYADKNKVGFVVSFAQKKTSKINWERSKRLMFGSLLVFSNDNFKTIIFGTVLDRKPEELKNGLIVVELSNKNESDPNEMPELFKSDFTMVESEVYFEPYYHVLKALQKMKSSEFPMSRYIVNVQATVNPPQYILNAQDYEFRVDGFKIPVLNKQAWPSAGDLSLDDSQYRAFQSALSQEFVVIQGPPGTGKTYLGLRIAKAIIMNIPKIIMRAQRPVNAMHARLLNHIRDGSDSEGEDAVIDYLVDAGLQDADTQEEVNVDSSEVPTHTPLLVVCFTNHALDQFLEGLLPTTRKIVRIGGQSKSEVLKEFNLREIRRQSSYLRSRDLQWLTRNIRDEMAVLLADFKGTQEDIEHLNNNFGIVSLFSINQVYQHQNLKAFVNDYGQLSDDLFLEWLMSNEEVLEYDDVTVGNFENEGPLLMDVEAAPLHAEDEDDEWRRAVDDDLDIDQLPANFKLSFALEPTDARSIRRDIAYLQRSNELDKEITIWHLEMKLRTSRHISNRLQNVRQQDVVDATAMMERNVALWQLKQDQRWALYKAWVERMRVAMFSELQVLEANYRMQATKLEETQLMEDLRLIRVMNVVGMTTTGAARLQPLLQSLKCRVVIVEEAAEVMESHIIVSLTNHCEHLILIGDHQQLRPTTAVYKLARDFNFDISLFERMLRNGLHCEVLKVQHRMRPEIARLIVPSIYKDLHNHESVLRFSPVPGVRKNVFFLTHNQREKEIAETHSRDNTFEADFLLEFCRYLLMQGYAPECITILATYSGQMFYLRNKKKTSPALSGVQITIVDNFQGEENDIILLSLVRNNEENNVGFLKTENRVCVALSRARHGLFIMGNMDNLTHGGGLWCEIKSALEDQGSLGETLPLYCMVHQDQLTNVRCAEDFRKVPEGGCLLPCAANLQCGHVCVRSCHAADREHKRYQCRKACARSPPYCGLLHPCPKVCFEECGDCMTPVPRELPCGHNMILPCHVDYMVYNCLEKVQITSEVCGHTFDKLCYQGPDTYRCLIPCDIRLDCGHTCNMNCHVTDDPDHEKYECMKPCPEKNVNCTQDHICARLCHEECGLCCVKVVKQASTCDHKYTVDCSLDPLEIRCEKKCKKMLACGHPCPLKCYEKCGDCKVMVTKTVSECGHSVRIECSTDPQRRHCTGPCQRTMSCGHRCNRTCKVACASSNSCTELVPSAIVPACGHALMIPCNLRAQGLAANSPKLLEHCTQPCNGTLECGHGCEGTCGQCLQARIHRECKAKCGRNLICGHSCTVPCARTCPPCQQKCRMRCVHSRCTNKCGVPCQRCNEKCEWRCRHARCTKRCWELCNREPCKEPCKELLKCKHPCIGFCGEPCPPRCRECDREQVETIIFGNEDDPEARFVYLEDCKHVIESDALETWLTQHRDEVTMPQCPLCKTDIMKTMRYMNEIKRALKDIQDVKKKIFGEMNALENQRYQLLLDLQTLKPPQQRKQVNSRRYPYFQRDPVLEPAVNVVPLTLCGAQLHRKLYTLLDVQPTRGKRGKPRYNLSSVDLQSASLQLQIFKQVQELYNNAYPKVKMEQSCLQTLEQHADLILGFLVRSERVNAQAVDDINLELLRFQRITQLCQLEVKTVNFQSDKQVGSKLVSCREAALSIKKYSNDQDGVLLERLQQLNRAVDASGRILQEKERKEIVKAIGLLQGHWFKCPNGHFYAIGECGGAMQEGKCIECKASIGGTQHRLRSDNRLAPEMDGARHSAWPGAAMNFL